MGREEVQAEAVEVSGVEGEVRSADEAEARLVDVAARLEEVEVVVVRSAVDEAEVAEEEAGLVEEVVAVDSVDKFIMIQFKILNKTKLKLFVNKQIFQEF